MALIRDGLPIEVLVEVIAAHDCQSLAGTPESRIEGRIVRSVELARQTGFVDLEVRLDRQDFGWLCMARRLERYSDAARQMRIGGMRVARAGPEFESHLMGRWKSRLRRSFPIIGEPTLTPGFVRYIASDADKTDLQRKFQAEALNLAVQRPAHGKWH